MKRFQLLSGSLFLIITGFIIAFVFLANRETELLNDRANLMKYYRVFPVPFPAEIYFANEKVPLSDDEVRERLDRELLINTYWQSNTLLMIKRTKRAFAVIEPILKKYGVPDDFKYLAVIESGLSNVVSGSGAAGVWQFLKATGESYGLEVNDNVDERYHLEKATEAACKYLLNAKEKLGNWTMAAAAYNRGLQGVLNARKSQYQENYYQLYLNSETSRYVCRMIAMKLIIENPHHYGFQMRFQDYYPVIETYAVKIDTSISDLPKWSSDRHTTYKAIRELNPWLLGYELKANSKNGYELLVPVLKSQGSESEK